MAEQDRGFFDKTPSEVEENLNAIVEYFNKSEPKTDKARSIKDEFAKWYANLSWYSSTFETDNNYRKARNYRDAYNLANSTSAEEREQVKRVIKEGVSTEKAMGEEAKARLSSGAYATSDSSSGDLLTTKGKIYVGLAGLLTLVGVGWLLKNTSVVGSSKQSMQRYLESRKQRVATLPQKDYYVWVYKDPPSYPESKRRFAYGLGPYGSREEASQMATDGVDLDYYYNIKTSIPPD